MITVTDGMRIQGGRLKGQGSIVGSVELGNATAPTGVSVLFTTAAGAEVYAELQPGQSPGELAISGDYTQGATGALTVEVDGASETQIDTLTVGGDTRVDGLLQVQFKDGVDPSSDAGVQLLVSNGAAEGEFAEILFININTNLNISNTTQVNANSTMTQQPTIDSTAVNEAQQTATDAVIADSSLVGDGLPGTEPPETNIADTSDTQPEGPGGDGPIGAEQKGGATGERGPADGEGGDGASEGEGGESGATRDGEAATDERGSARESGDGDKRGDGDGEGPTGDDDAGAGADESEADEPVGGGDCGPSS